MLFAMAALVLLQVVGAALSTWLNIPVPGPLMGMALMLIALCVIGRLPQALRRVSNSLVSHLMLLFIPSVAAIMTQVDHVRAEWLPFVAASVVGTALTILATAMTLRYMLKRQRD